MSKKIPMILTVLLFIIGVGVLSYPFVSNLVYERNAGKVIEHYEDAFGIMRQEEIDHHRTLAQEYNAMLTGSGIKDPFIPDSGFIMPEEYYSILNIDGMMAHIRIPKINIHLPIYHGTADDVLTKGVGHLEATSFPIGGKGNHAVLTGHSGLASAELFNNLEKLEIDDVFYIHIMNEILAYQIDQILVVDPSATNELRPVAEEDYVTLITCTPYAINSHRLFVRGRRIPYVESEEEGVTSSLTLVTLTVIVIILIVTVVMIIPTAIYFVVCNHKKRK